MINKTIRRIILLTIMTLIVLLLSCNSAYADSNKARYLMDAVTMSNNNIAVLFVKGGTSSNNIVSGGRLYLGFYNPANNSWQEMSVGSAAPEAKEAALDLYNDKAHVAYITTDNKLAYIYQTDEGWSEPVIIGSANANGGSVTTDALSCPDIATDSNGKVHIAYVDTDGAEDNDYHQADGMYATNAQGGFIISCVVSCSGLNNSPYGIDRDTLLTPIKIDYDGQDRLISFKVNYYSTDSYGGKYNSYTLFFNTSSDATSSSLDTNGSATVHEVCRYDDHYYTLISKDNYYYVYDGKIAMDGTQIPATSLKADMTLNGSQIYYAEINGNILKFYQNGEFVDNKETITSISNHNKFVTVVSGDKQYVLYTGTDDDTSLVISKYDNDEVSEFLVPNEIKSWTELQNALSAGGTVVLTQDIIAESTDTTLSVPGTTILDLNGYIIDGNEYATPVIRVEERANLTLNDSNPTREHSPAFSYVNPITSEDVTVNGGIITGGKDGNWGNGIDVPKSTLTLNGGSIVKNTTTTGNGAGVFVHSGSTFNMNGGLIAGNYSAGSGGGLYAYYDNTINMAGGSIKHNSADGKGGGVYLWNNQSGYSETFNMSGGSIEENLSTQDGGGICIDTRGIVNVSGKPIIVGNKQGTVNNNLYGSFNVVGALLDGTSIGVTTANRPTYYVQTFTNGYSTYNNGVDPSNYFISDYDDSVVVLTDNNEAGLALTYSVSVTSDENGTASADITKGITGTQVNLSYTVTDSANYRFREWQVISGGVTIENNCFTIGTADVEVKAIFEEIPEYTLSFDANGGTDSMEPVTQREGTTYALPRCDFTAPEGYRFKDWIVIPEDGSGEQYYNLGTEITFDQNYTIKPRWTPIEYTITYILNGGVFQNQTPPSTYTIESGDIAIDNLTRNDLTFAGWTGTGLSEPTLNLTIPSGSVGNRTYTAEWVVDYNLWVGSTRVNSGNARDVLKDGGTVMYDVTTNTLTLNNATIVGAGDSERGYGIKYLGNTNLSIVADGINVISDPTTRTDATAGILLGGDIGVYSQNFTRSDYTANLNLTVHEDSSLWIAGGTAVGGYYPSSYGICLWQDSGNIILSGKGDLRVTLGISTYNYGIYAPDNLTINSTGEVYIPGGDSSSPRYYSEGIHGNSITINSGNVVIAPGDAEFASVALSTDGASFYGEEYGDITINGGTVSALGGKVNKNNGTGDYDKSKSYGIYSDKDIIINGEDLVVARTSATDADVAMALNKAPIINTGNIAGANIEDTQNEALVYVPENNDTYKWFQTPYTKPEASVQNVRGLFVRYNDDYQELVEAENVKGGTIVYSLDGENFSEEIPKAKEKNKYTVYYKVIGDFNHNDSQVGSVQAQIYYPAGLIKKDGKLVFAEFGEIATYKTTLAKYDVDGIWYYVQEGEVKPGANTLVKYEGLWFYIENSMINWNYTGLFKYGGRWFYIKNGEVQFGANTLFKYKGVWFYINKGEIDWNYTGLFKYSGVWFYIRNGEVDWNANTLVKYNGKWYYINRGEIDWNFTGIFYYEGLNFYIRKGELTWGFDGTINYNGKNYTIRNSTVV